MFDLHTDSRSPVDSCSAAYILLLCPGPLQCGEVQLFSVESESGMQNSRSYRDYDDNQNAGYKQPPSLETGRLRPVYGAYENGGGPPSPNLLTEAFRLSPK